jgi:hypothetical protein
VLNKNFIKGWQLILKFELLWLFKKKRNKQIIPPKTGPSLWCFVSIYYWMCNGERKFVLIKYKSILNTQTRVCMNVCSYVASLSHQTMEFSHWKLVLSSSECFYRVLKSSTENNAYKTCTVIDFNHCKVLCIHVYLETLNSLTGTTVVLSVSMVCLVRYSRYYD